MLKVKTMYLLKLIRFTLYPLYIFSFIVPKKKDIWLFGSHQNRFSENAKALFLYSSQYNKSIQSVWITGDSNLSLELQKQGLLAFNRWSFKGVYYTLRAKYYFYNVYSDDINFYTSGNAILVNLWHGIPLKQIEFDVKRGKLYNIFNGPFSFVYAFFKPYIFRNPNYVLSTSTKVSKIFSSSFRVDISQCLEFGYPRTDFFYNNKDANNIIEQEKKMILYMPTWRNNSSGFLEKAIPCFDKLNALLTSCSYELVIKLHPNDYSDNKDFSNIKFLNPKDDICTLLLSSNYLITDYSSIYFDYLLLDKEIIFYPFDLDEYMSLDRELYFNYKDKTPGIKAYSFDSLLDILLKLETLDFQEERLKIKNEFWKYQDGNASQRIVDYFKAKN